MSSAWVCAAVMEAESRRGLTPSAPSLGVRGNIPAGNPRCDGSFTRSGAITGVYSAGAGERDPIEHRPRKQ